MKRLFVKLLYFILPLLAMFVWMEYSLRQIPNDYAYKKQYLDQHSNEIETLILGSSHANFGINPDYFPKNAFNASHVSQSFFYDFEISKKYDHQWNHLKIIVLPISCFTFWSENFIGGIEAWRAKYYTIFYNIEPEHFTLSNHFILADGKIIKHWKPIFNWYMGGKNDIHVNELGWGTNYNSQNAQDLEKTGKTAAERHSSDLFSQKDIECFNNNVLILNNLGNYCDAHHIKLVLTTTPTYQTYRENINKPQLDKMFETIHQFVAAHPNSVYLNYFEDPDFTASDFYDADHLNEIGAEKFSKKLAHDMDAM